MDHSTLLCWRVKELAGGPPVPSVIDSCAVCGVAVWRSLSSPETDRVVCMSCGTAEIKADPDAEVMPPTKKQMRDLVEGLKWHD